MLYTIKINDSSTKAQSIINLLKTFAKDYDFLQIYKGSEYEITEEMKKELDRRYEHFLQNPDEGKSWDEVRRNLLKK